MTKTCTRCHQTKPLEAFHRASSGKYGRNSQCRDCINASKRAAARSLASLPKRSDVEGQCVYIGCSRPAANPTSGLCASHHVSLSNCRESPLELSGGEWVAGPGGVRRWVA